MSEGVALSIVVPTYNERDRLAELVGAVFSACRAAGVELELIVVDDNSPDGTGQLADELAQGRRMVVVHRSGKLGLGTAVVAGFARASASIVGVMDADFSHPPALLPTLFHTLQATGADLVIASRYVPGGSTPNWPAWRRMMSRAGCLLARSITPIRDAASGFFLIRRDLARGTEIKAGGFKICLELVIRGWPARIVEVPYRFEDRELGDSKMGWGEAAKYLVQLRDLMWVRWTGPPRPAQEHRQLTPDEVREMDRAASRLSSSGATH
jgi:dolichol-phosphate mannosyltransferase